MIEKFIQENPEDPAVIAWLPWQTLPDGLQVKGNVIDGFGLIKYATGHQYQGMFQAAKFHGQGRLTRDGILVFEGQWIEGISQ